jgi:DnaJ family protein A protein 5
LEEANKKFLEIQDAYETLMDDQERAWYDSHREVLLNGGLDGGANAKNYVYNVYPYFTSSCFKGYGDDEKVMNLKMLKFKFFLNFF